MTWLESVDVDMVELEIDKEDVHDRKKWRGSPTLSENGYKPRIIMVTRETIGYGTNIHHRSSNVGNHEL